MSTKKQIAQVDFETGTYIGNEEDGVYYTVAEGPDGWYMSASVDCNSHHWTDTLITDDGPYATETAAREAGRNAATDWCLDNHVEYEEPETRVLFRADRSGPHRGEVTAVFPDLPFDYDGAQLTCYMHVGQHSGCTWRWVREVTRPATPAEYAKLARELTGIGYRLKIVTRR